MNRLTLAALGLASALMVSGAALQMAPAHATTTQLQSAPAVQTEAATAEVVKKNFNNPPPVKKKKKKKHHAMKKKPAHHAMKKKPIHHATTHHKKKKPVQPTT